MKDLLEKVSFAKETLLTIKPLLRDGNYHNSNRIEKMIDEALIKINKMEIDKCLKKPLKPQLEIK